MAAPVGESFYCIPEDVLDQHQCIIYSALSVATGLLGFFGALYQLTIWKPHYSSRVQHLDSILQGNAPEPLQRSSTIVFSLALSDLFACAFIILKGVALPLIDRPSSIGDHHQYKVASISYVYWGLPLESCERFFYVCTYLWTLCFAVDILLKLTGRHPDQRLYHLIWPLAALLIGASLGILLTGSIDYCTVCLQLQLAYIPSFWLPVFTVMVANPLLYFVSSHRIRDQLRSTGRYTDDERHLLNVVKIKFLLMMFVFYFCWWTAIMALVINVQDQCTHKTYSILLILSAAFNPLQGLLNCLVYGKHHWFSKLVGRASFVRYETPSPSSENDLFRDQSPSGMMDFTTSGSSIHAASQH
ncbi:G-protein coupled receptor 143-like [Corticium candelabrum]|uniref:G-protein coupled receptor 143-like n=1 Tax=Corticium candelabrum TaxID=121492 RepID=UPI002E255A67|nr:G-protein coupled receptor 143-like [Corticium candelabrum]